MIAVFSDIHGNLPALEACFDNAVLTGEAEDLRIELVAVAYDHERAAAQAERNGRLDWAVPLRTGFVD